MRHRSFKALVVFLLLAGVSVGAALLGVTGGLPNTTFSNPGSLAYVAASGALNITATPISTRFPAAPTPILRLFDSTAPRSVSISIQLNPDGTVAGGAAGDDLVLRGRITAPDGTVYDGTGPTPLLTGEVLAFGYADGAIDLFDFRFALTGGLLAPLYNGQDIAVSVQSDVNNTFAGVFTADFGGNAKGSLGPIPPLPPPCRGTIGDFVWLDANRNGIQDANEHGIDGVTVTLTPTNPAGPIQTTVTGPSPTGQAGYYQFRDLCAGEYTVTAETPNGTSETLKLVGAPDTDSNGSPTTVTLPTDQSSDQTIDFGFVTPCTGAIGDYVWTDLNDNGIQDANETGLNGVTVQLLDGGGNVLATAITANSPQTGLPGYYLFDGLCGGSYQVRFLKPDSFDHFSPTDQGSDDTVDSDADQTTGTAQVVLPEDATDLTIDAGLVPPAPCTATIGDFVWNDVNGDGIQDQGEQGINGVLVELKDGTGTVIQSTFTTTNNGQAGYYQFSGVPCETSYQVWVTRPAAYSQFSPALQGTDVTIDSNGQATMNGTFSVATVSLAPGITSDQTIDFGFYACSGMIGDFVWVDLNGNGIQEVGEPGIPNVTLLLQDGTGQSLGITAQTDATGYYLFTGLCAGDYRVVVLSGIPAGLQPTPSNVGADRSVDSNGSPASVTLPTDFASDLTIDFGYRPPAAIGDRVWSDLNANGIQDAGEPGIAGVSVTLYTCTNGLVGSTTTDANGLYLFQNLAPGCYYVSFGTVATYVASPANQGANDAQDSDAVNGVTGQYTLAAGETNLTVDAGFYQRAALGDFVWKDVNSNGVQDAGEPGIAGVAVTLLLCDGSPTGQTTTTNASGLYLFSNLTPGCYRVQFGTPSGYTPSPANVGSDATDSDAVSGITGNYVLAAGQTDLTADAGFFPTPVPVCVPLAFDFTKYGNSAVSGAAGNIRTFTSGGVNVKVSAFSETKPGAAFSAAYLGIYTHGLGVTDGSENGSNNTHVVDNSGRNNYVLFEFSQPVIIDAALLDYIVGDSDIKVWIGNVANVYNNHLNLNATVLNGLAFTEVNTGGSSTRTADLNASGLAGNVLVVAAKTDETNDGFKLSKVTTTCPGICQPISSTVSFTGNTATYGTAGNIRSFTVGGVNLKASAFSRSDSSGAWATAYLGAYSLGLGVTDTSEGTGTNDRHRVDNIDGRNNYVLFEFAAPVVLDKAFLDYVGADSDISVWIGTKTDPYNNHLTLSDTLLNTLQREDNATPDVTSGSRWADVNANKVSGNVVVISALAGDTTPEDGFKLSKLTTTACK